MNSRASLLVACFLLSGFAGLVYEVVWVRMLGLLFGSTTLAVSTILAVYFSGLSLGSYVFGRIADRTARHPLRLYGALEIAAGAFALLSPPLFSLLDALYASAVTGKDLSFGAASLLKFACAFAVLIGPTTLLGGTLPLVVRGLASASADPPGGRLARLYGMNTIGAVGGTIAAGFFLIPLAGVRGSLLAAAAIDFAVGVAAFALARRVPAGGAAETDRAAGRAAAAMAAPAPARGSRRRIGPLAITAAAGFASLALEVLFTRAIVTLAGSTVYAFTIILAVFLLGIGLGSSLVGRRVDALAEKPAALAALLGITALLAAAAMLAYSLLPLARPALVGALGYSFAVDAAVVCLFAAVLVFPASLVFGALFPIAARALAAGEGDIGRSVGVAYAANTIAGIAGSLVTGFVLLPAIGLVASLRAISCALAIAAGAAAFAAAPRRAALPAALSLAAVALALSSPSIDRARLTNDLARPGAAAPGAASRARVLHYRDGMDATVSVIERGGYRSLYVNGRIQARNDRANLRLYDALAILPIALARGSENVLVVGLGSGITAGAASLAAPGKLTCVEISEDVVEGAGFFADENARVLERTEERGFRLVHDDARSFLLASGEKFDAIAANAFLPSDAGAGALYTREHFESCREHLAPGGVMSQWIPLASLSADDLATAIASFSSAFEDTTLWMVAGDLLLVGGKEAIAPDLAEIRERLALVESGAPGRLARSRIESAEQVLGFCVADGASVRALFGRAPLHTDDRPRLEYSAPRHVYRDNLAANMALVESAAPRSGRSPVASRVANASEAERAAIDGHFRATRAGLAARRLDAEGNADAAAEAYARARSEGVRDPLGAEAHADLLARSAWSASAAGNEAEALRLRLEAARIDPSPENELEYATALASAGRAADAIERLRALAAREPRIAEARINLGVLLANEGLLEDAERELGLAAAAAPSRPEPPFLLGQIALARGDRAGAVAHFRRALSIDPEDEAIAAALEDAGRE